MRAIPIVCVFVLLLAVIPAEAQFESGAVVGIVHDATGAVVPDATITLLSPDTGVGMTRPSAQDGSFEFLTVKPGVYVVSAEKAGLAVALVENVRVQVGGRQRVDLTETEAFGTRTLRVPVTLTGQRWVRFEVWDVAANGAFTQPVWVE